MVLENNRNGRTKCYSTSAAALKGPKKSQSPAEYPITPETTPILMEPDQEVKVAVPTENGDCQQTNGLPLSSSSASTTILEDGVRETLLPASDVSQDILGCVSSAPAQLSTMSNSGCKESAGVLPTSQHFQPRSETSI